MVDALRLEVKKDAWKQNQAGSYKLTFTVNPTDLDDNAQDILMDFFKAPMGAVYMLGAARVGDDGQPAKRPPAAPEKAKVPFKDKPLVTQAGIRCADPAFYGFLCIQYMSGLRTCRGENDAAVAAEFVRKWCGVETRGELGGVGFDDESQKWIALNVEFEQWAGYLPEQR